MLRFGVSRIDKTIDDPVHDIANGQKNTEEIRRDARRHRWIKMYPFDVY